MALPNVTATLTIKGKDDASAAIDKAGKAAGGLTGKLQQAQKAAEGATGSLKALASGDVKGGLQGLAGALGGGSGLAGAAAATVAGVAGIATAIGVAAVKATEWSIELERLRAQMRFAFEGGEAQALALAQAVGGVAVESVVKLQTTLKASGAEGKITVEQMQAIANAATAMGKTGDDALAAFADAIRTGSSEALKQVGVTFNSERAIKQYAVSVGKTTDQLTAAERSQAILNATLAEVPTLVQAGTNTYAKQDAALADLANATTALKLELSALVSGPAVRLVESVNSLGVSFGALKTILVELVKVSTAPLRGMASGIERVARAAVLLKRGDLGEAAVAAGEAFAKLSTLGTAQLLDEWSGRTLEGVQRQFALEQQTTATAGAIEAQSGKVGGLATAYDAFIGAADKATQAQTRFAAADKAAEKSRAAAAKARSAAAAKALAERRARQGEEFLRGVDTDTEAQQARMREIAADEARSAGELDSAYRALQDRVLGVYASIATDPARKAMLEQQQIEIAAAREIAEIQSNLYYDTAQQAALSAAVQVEAQHRIAEAQRQATAAQMQQAEAYANAGKAVAGALLEADIAKRVSAGIDAALETARAIAAFASYDIPGGIQHTAAAIAFGKIALTPSPTPQRAAASAPQPAREPAQRDQGPARSVVINLHGIATTSAEVGVGLHKALKAAMPTGFAA